MNAFQDQTRFRFANCYPEMPHALTHGLESHPLLELESLAQLAESLPLHSIECNSGDQPIGVDAVPEQTRDRIGETIRNIKNEGRWVGLRNVEQDPEYAELLAELLDELSDEIEGKTGPLINLQSFIFITSAGGVTPYHFDPEHNILLQIRGSKVMTVFPAGDPDFASDELHETYHAGGRPELPWQPDMSAGGMDFELGPGDAVYVPVMAPHYVRTGSETSISISITWRSKWSHAESDARCFNGMMRQIGMRPHAPGRWPRQNLAKAYGWRIIRRLKSMTS